MTKVETDIVLAMCRNREMRAPVPVRGNVDNVTKKLTAMDGSKVEITYSHNAHRTTACVVDIKGDKKAIKPENMPRDLREIHDPIAFGAFLRDVYVRTKALSDGNVKLEVDQRLRGGMPQKPTTHVGLNTVDKKVDVGKVKGESKKTTEKANDNKPKDITEAMSEQRLQKHQAVYNVRLLTVSGQQDIGQKVGVVSTEDKAGAGKVKADGKKAQKDTMGKVAIEPQKVVAELVSSMSSKARFARRIQATCGGMKNIMTTKYKKLDSAPKDYPPYLYVIARSMGLGVQRVEIIDKDNKPMKWGHSEAVQTAVDTTHEIETVNVKYDLNYYAKESSHSTNAACVKCESKLVTEELVGEDKKYYHSVEYKGSEESRAYQKQVNKHIRNKEGSDTSSVSSDKRDVVVVLDKELQGKSYVNNSDKVKVQSFDSYLQDYKGAKITNQNQYYMRERGNPFGVE